MGKKRMLVAALCAAAAASLSAGPALAGEITGNGKWIAGTEEAPLNGKSECAYSGQNDEHVLGDESAARAQSWGQLVAEAGPMGGGPGFACNPARASG
jgi:hypothetical protein